MFLLHLVVSLSIRALVVNTQLREHRLECGFSTSGPFLTVEDQAAVKLPQDEPQKTAMCAALEVGLFVEGE